MPRWRVLQGGDGELRLFNTNHGVTETMLGVSLLASEYSTGPVHRGRIDSLGLDENRSPVIVEFADRR